MNIKVPASSANLGIGFDTLGLSLNLFNEFQFKPNFSDKLVNFPDTLENNLVYMAYTAFFAAHKTPHRRVVITQMTQDIPVARGLGSSAACILAGVFAANEIGNLGSSYAECVRFAADYEGHPDNVYAAAYGGLIGVFADNEKYIHHKFELHKSLCYTLLIPAQETNTKELRDVLPEKIALDDAVHNVARIAQLPSALVKGDISKLNLLLDDRIHEPHRLPQLASEEEITQLKRHKDIAVVLSGSGSSLLVLSKAPIDDYLTDALLATYKAVAVDIGAKLEIIK